MSFSLLYVFILLFFLLGVWDCKNRCFFRNYKLLITFLFEKLHFYFKITENIVYNEPLKTLNPIHLNCKTSYYSNLTEGKTNMFEFITFSNNKKSVQTLI